MHAGVFKSVASTSSATPAGPVFQVLHAVLLGKTLLGFGTQRARNPHRNRQSPTGVPKQVSESFPRSIRAIGGQCVSQMSINEVLP